MPYNDLLTGRVSIPNQIYHVTMVTNERVPLFAESAIAELAKQGLQAAENQVDSLAWVIMPDHIHWLFQLKTIPLSIVVKRFKGSTARAVNLANGSSGSIWQPSFHDHALRVDEDVKTVARYIVANPLRAGLVNNIADYPWWWAVWMNPL